MLKQNAPWLTGATLDVDRPTVTLQLAGGESRIVPLAFGPDFVTLIWTDLGDMTHFDVTDPQSYKRLAKVRKERFGLAYRP